MRVTTAIFTLESPNNGVQSREADSLQESLQVADQGKSKIFISLYSGKASTGRIETLAKAKRRAATRPEANFAISIMIRIACARDEFLRN